MRLPPPLQAVPCEGRRIDREIGIPGLFSSFSAAGGGDRLDASGRSAMLAGMAMLRSLLAVGCLLCLAVVVRPAGLAAQDARPQVPCVPGAPVFPGYGAEGAEPEVAVWRDIELSPDEACGSRLQGRLDLAVALSSRFRHSGTLDDLAARAGAISKTVGLTYWSATEGKWRKLITAASALKGPDGDWRSGEMWRPDFSAAEVRSGAQLWFMQNDTRSTGANLYRLRALDSTDDRLVVEIVNESPITFTFLTLFGEHELLSLQMVERLAGDLWGYYSLSAVRGDAADEYEKSLINRAVAFYRFLQGKPGDSGPPLAK